MMAREMHDLLAAPPSAHPTESHSRRHWPLRAAARRTRLHLVVALLAVPGLAAAPLAGQSASEPAEPKACVALLSDAERLACYDRAFGREAAPGEPPAPVTPPATASTATDNRAPQSLLDSRWELLPESKLGTFNLRAYQPVYVLPWVGTPEANQFPSSPAPGHTVESAEELSKSEVKLQVSGKTKLWQGIFGEAGDLWFGYTQSSRWQLYNAEQSRPFRETNYEPELLLAFATRYRLFDWDGRLLAFGLNHQSNGRALPRSRSWNRVTASVGLEREGWTVTVRPWYRLPEDAAHDDNPDIEDYVGRADVLVVHHIRHHEITAMLRHSLRDGDRSHGAAQVDWAFPLRGNLRGHVQVFHGYGESLIDYNFRSTRLGLGLSLVEWY